MLVLVYFNSLHANNFTLKIESGALWQNRNDVKIYPDSGSYIEFDEWNKGPFFHIRTELFFHLNTKHHLRLLVAPLNFEVKKSVSETYNYKNRAFNTLSPISIDYKFNSYRFSYIYTLFDESNHELNIGATIKIRDAHIDFKQDGLTTKYSNVGVVPLLYLSYMFKINNTFSFYSDLDFAAAPQGRAFDSIIKINWFMNTNNSLGFGYRTLEGGADNDKVFTFSWLNYLVLDFVTHF
jgi:hypothetical protein